MILWYRQLLADIGLLCFVPTPIYVGEPGDVETFVLCSASYSCGSFFHFFSSAARCFFFGGSLPRTHARGAVLCTTPMALALP